MQITPVAEYKGVAIAECPGNVPKHYRGVDYTTDGYTYLFYRQTDKEELTWLQLPSERAAKAMIDAEEFDELMSYAELCEVLKVPPPPKTVLWQWIEDDERFTQVSE